MLRTRMENISILVIVLSLLIYALDCVVASGKTMDPIYWTSSNSMFKSGRNSIDVAINDKLDIICPRKGRDDGEELFYFKLYLVSAENYRKCNTSGARRLITCDVPEREKKYTFYFQEISPSPWGLEFDPGESYYLVSTSDGSKSGLDGRQGGVCTRFNMKIEMKIHEEEDLPPTRKPIKTKPIHKVTITPAKVPRPNPNTDKTPKEPTGDIAISDKTAVADNNGSESSDDAGQVSGNGLIIGIAVGAFAVLFIVLLSLLAYRMYRKRRHTKKYQAPPMTPTRGANPLQQVTLLPISPHGHPHHHGRLHSDHDRHRSATLSSHTDMRPPPSYNESFLDNGGPVVAV